MIWAIVVVDVAMLILIFILIEYAKGLTNSFEARLLDLGIDPMLFREEE